MTAIAVKITENRKNLEKLAYLLGSFSDVCFYSEDFKFINSAIMLRKGLGAIKIRNSLIKNGSKIPKPTIESIYRKIGGV